METKYKDKLFNIIKNSKTNYGLFEEVLSLLDETVLDYTCKQKVGEYMFLSELTNSINNAGHEERRSNDISKISQKQNDLIKFITENNRENYLP